MASANAFNMDLQSKMLSPAKSYSFPNIDRLTIVRVDDFAWRFSYLVQQSASTVLQITFSHQLFISIEAPYPVI